MQKMKMAKIEKMNKTVGVVRERERESNRLEKIALICDTKNNSIKNINKNAKSIKCATIMAHFTSIICTKIVCEKHTKIKRVDYIANRRKEKLLFTG